MEICNHLPDFRVIVNRMTRLLHRSLKRGHTANRLAWLLLVCLLAVLVLSFYHGVRSLPLT